MCQPQVYPLRRPNDPLKPRLARLLPHPPVLGFLRDDNDVATEIINPPARQRTLLLFEHSFLSTTSSFREVAVIVDRPEAFDYLYVL